jgi:predicted oxidoreductase
MIIQGKCGIRKENGRAYYDFSKEYILSSTDAILERLQTDYLDVLLLHRPDTLMEPEEVAEAFSRLKESGKVRYFGLSNANTMQIELLQRACKDKLLFDQVQIGLGHSGLFDSGIAMNTDFRQGADRSGSLLEYTRLKGITLQAWSPLQYGMFEGVIFSNPAYDELNKMLESLSEKYGTAKAAIAVAWILRHPAGIQVICGSTKQSHVEDYCAAAGIQLTRAEWYALYQAAGNTIP